MPQLIGGNFLDRLLIHALIRLQCLKDALIQIASFCMQQFLFCFMWQKKNTIVKPCYDVKCQQRDCMSHFVKVFIN